MKLGFYSLACLDIYVLSWKFICIPIDMEKVSLADIYELKMYNVWVYAVK